MTTLTIVTKFACCRLTELKAESRRRREQREMDAMMLVAETKRRREIVERQFYEWNDGKRVDSALIHAALRTYAEMYNASLLFSRPLDANDRDLGGFYLADYMAVNIYYLLFVFLIIFFVDETGRSANGQNFRDFNTLTGTLKPQGDGPL